MDNTRKKYLYWEWRTILVLFIGYGLFYFVRKNLSVAIPAMEAELGISKVHLGIFLTLPISSAAIGISMGLEGLAAGAAVVGCCCNMIGFAVASYRENKFGGLVAQGLGTSMLQMPNIVRRPQIWLPAIISSAILGPVSSAIFKIVSTPVGSGMGTAGLVGPFETYFAMVDAGRTPVMSLLLIALMCFILPAVISLGVCEIMRKMRWIKDGYMRLPDNG